MSTAPWFLDTSSPDEVARANFPIVRRGFDPVEVQAFARAIGTEIARLQALNAEYGERMAEAESRANAKVDETTVAEFLGEESSRLLLAARDTANEVRVRAEDYANVTVRGADTYAKNRTAEADAYHLKVTQEADQDAARTRREARDDAERARAEAKRDAEQLIAETMAHRAQLLTDLTARRDKGLEQLRALVAGRNMLVEAIDQVRLTASGLVGDLQDISTAPASFVSLDPSIEGPGDVLDEGASVAVSRERRSARARRAARLPATDVAPDAGQDGTDAAEKGSGPSNDASATDGIAPGGSEAAANGAGPARLSGRRSTARRDEAFEVEPQSSIVNRSTGHDASGTADPITEEVPVIGGPLATGDTISSAAGS
jgi:cell division septum initiation protein DivIVA